MVGFCEGGPQPQRLVVLQDCLALATEFMEDVTQIATGLGIFRFCRDGALVVDERGIVQPELVKHAGEVVMDLGIVGPDFQRLLVMRDGLFGTVENTIGIAKAGVSFRQIRFQQQRLLMIRQRLFPFAEPLQRRSDIVVRLGIIRLDGKRFQIVRDRSLRVA